MGRGRGRGGEVEGRGGGLFDGGNGLAGIERQKRRGCCRSVRLIGRNISEEERMRSRST